MALSKALSGFRPSRIRGNGPNSTGQGEYTIASGLAQNIFYGDLVTMNAGNIEVVTTIVDDKIAGVFAGQGLKAAGRGDDGQMTVLAAFKEAGNALGDAFPRVEVLLKQHVDNYVTVGVSAG